MALRAAHVPDPMGSQWPRRRKFHPRLLSLRARPVRRADDAQTEPGDEEEPQAPALATPLSRGVGEALLSRRPRPAARQVRGDGQGAGARAYATAQSATHARMKCA